MTWIEYAALGALGLIIGFAIGAWGIVQVLDIMEALDLRRIERQRQLEKARQYLRDPNNDNTAVDTSSGWTNPSTWTTTTSNKTTNWTNSA